MAYRETVRTRANSLERRTRIERSARHVIAKGGFASASVAAVAREAECSAGSIYTYYENREELLRIVFATAAGYELRAVESALDEVRTLGEIAASVVDVFVRRAVAGRRLAHALLLEEVPDAVQLERLALRRGYVAAVVAAMERVDASGSNEDPPSAPPIPAEVSARAIIGGIGENLVDLLDPRTPPPRAHVTDALITALSAHFRSALGER